jgi:hypothetical protein
MPASFSASASVLAVTSEFGGLLTDSDGVGTAAVLSGGADVARGALAAADDANEAP